MRNKSWMVFVFALLTVSCTPKPPIDWMRSELIRVSFACEDEGRRDQGKINTANLVYIWSCAYPKNFDVWLKKYESAYLFDSGWKRGVAPVGQDWLVYCHNVRPVVMRLVRDRDVESKINDRLLILIRFPRGECSQAGK